MGPRLDSEYGSRWTISVALFVLSYVLKWTIMSLHSGAHDLWIMNYELSIMIMTKRCKRYVTLDAWRLAPGAWRLAPGGEISPASSMLGKCRIVIIIRRINTQCMLHVASRLWGLRGPPVLPTALAKYTHAGFVASWIVRMTRYYFYQRSWSTRVNITQLYVFLLHESFSFLQAQNSTCFLYIKATLTQARGSTNVLNCILLRNLILYVCNLRCLN